MTTNEESPALTPLKYQTWKLKVFIHCNGCTRKVKKLLRSIDGTYVVKTQTKYIGKTSFELFDQIILIPKIVFFELKNPYLEVEA